MTPIEGLTHESVTWTEGYSLEFLLGVEVFHEHLGTGRVHTTNDEDLTCRVCFKGVIHIELPVVSLISLKRPFHINSDHLRKRFSEYQTRVEELQRILAEGKAEIVDLESKQRWMRIFKVCFAPNELAIMVTPDEAQQVH